MISKFIFLSILSLIFAVLVFSLLALKIKKLFTIVLVAWQFGFVVPSFSSEFWGVRPFFAAVLGFMTPPHNPNPSLFPAI